LTGDLIFPFFALIQMKLSRTKIFWPLALLSVLLVAVVLVYCYLERRAVQRTEERFISTFVELSIAQKMFSPAEGGPEGYDSARSEILSRNGFSSEDFLALEAAYKDEPERWVRIWEGVVKRLEQQKEERRRQPIEAKRTPPKKRPVPP